MIVCLTKTFYSQGPYIAKIEKKNDCVGPKPVNLTSSNWTVFKHGNETMINLTMTALVDAVVNRVCIPAF